MNDNYQRLFQKRKVGADGELFSLDFPVAIPNIQKNPVHLVKMNLETPMISSLKEIIRSHGDELKHASNVKADMTDWFMHQKYQEFKQLSIHVEAELKKVTGTGRDRNSKKELPFVTTECWGAVYRKGDETVPHTHWGSLWSWCYYLKVPEDASPFQFVNVYRESKDDKVNLDDISNLTGKTFDIYPQVDDLLFFPSHMRHGVPKSKSNEERIMIAGNVTIIHPLVRQMLSTK